MEGHADEAVLEADGRELGREVEEGRWAECVRAVGLAVGDADVGALLDDEDAVGVVGGRAGPERGVEAARDEAVLERLRVRVTRERGAAAEGESEPQCAA